MRPNEELRRQRAAMAGASLAGSIGLDGLSRPLRCLLALGIVVVWREPGPFDRLVLRLLRRVLLGGFGAMSFVTHVRGIPRRAHVLINMRAGRGKTRGACCPALLGSVFTCRCAVPEG
jgi:hypothetical protein